MNKILNKQIIFINLNLIKNAILNHRNSIGKKEFIILYFYIYFFIKELTKNFIIIDVYKELINGLSIHCYFKIFECIIFKK